jgi:tetratricopeptide (TPR) repeat protein
MVHRVAAFSVVLIAYVALSCSAGAQDAKPGDRLMSLQNDSTGQLAEDPSTSLAAINGTVRTRDNAPLADARVEIRELNTGKSLGVGYTGPSGGFELKNLPRGRYEVVATSGLSEAREQVQVDALDSSVTLRMPHVVASDGGQHTVSVADMRIPDKAKDELRKARAAVGKQKDDDARKHLAKALEIAPNYSDALTLRALMEIGDGKLQPATDDLASAIKNDNSNPTAYVAMGAVYNLERKFDDAILTIERGIALNPSAWQAYFEMSKAHLGKGDFDAALRQATKAEQFVGKDYSPIHLVKGHAFLGLKSYPEAIAEFEQYLSTEKDGPVSAGVRQQLQEVKSFAAAGAGRK